MNIVFRCYNCETINEIPSDFQFRFCKKCIKIITYEPGEAIISNGANNTTKIFLKSDTLTNSLADKFFRIAEDDLERISSLINKKESKIPDLLDMPAATESDTILIIMKQCKSNSLDEVIINCSNFGISKEKLEKVLVQLKKEGVIYLPKGWLLKLA
ncbi:MAG: hypothetical protein ACXABK_06865 [Candidatus Heimdallarchaeaceae archaeon]|jgi:DNA replicative helicase MCM subunit Mcm2 (Cdc46/Mcm family)